jgi:glucokinase
MIGAVDIGGTKLAVGLVDENGKVLAKNGIVTGSDSSYSAGLEKIAGMFREMERYACVEIAGIGIGSTGPIDPLTGELGDVDFLPHWRRKNPVRDLGKLFGVNVALENDADAGALAEAAWGQDGVSRG